MRITKGEVFRNTSNEIDFIVKKIVKDTTAPSATLAEILLSFQYLKSGKGDKGLRI
jgi:hypothetical protein